MVSTITLTTKAIKRKISNKSQKQRADILFSQFDDIKQFYYLALQLGEIYSSPISHDVARGKLALWFNKVEQWEYPQFNTVINTFKQHYERILNFFDNRLTNASAESFNAKLKGFRATFRGVDDVRFSSSGLLNFIRRN